jgi:RNA ligase
VIYKPNFEQLDKLVEQGYLAKKEQGDLVLYNYSEKCVFEKKWTKHTENSRGTIYEKSTKRVIAKSFPKFFNFSELSISKQRNILKQNNFEVFTKEDGSLGNVFFYNDKWNVTTRGSFESDQAVKATRMLSKYNLSRLNKNFTYIVEIIYPENRIIVNYGSKEELVLLASFETETGSDLKLSGLEDWLPFPIAESHKFNSIEEVIEAVSKMDSNSEGFVVKLLSGERFKVKSPEYLKIARLMSRMSPLTLWESMKDGKVSIELMQSIPEEFRADYEVIQKELERQYTDVQTEVNKHVTYVILNIANISTRLPENLNKDIGLYLSDHPNELNHFVFQVVNQKLENIDKLIMKEIRPTGNML